MKFTKVIWQELEQEVRWCLDVVRPLRYRPLASVKRRREQQKARGALGGPDVFLAGNINADELNQFQENAVILGEALLRDIQDRRAGISFLHDWGEFFYACGMIVSASTASQSDEGKKRAGKAGGQKVSKDIQRIWVSRELARRISAGLQRHQAERSHFRNRPARAKSAGTLEHRWPSLHLALPVL